MRSRKELSGVALRQSGDGRFSDVPWSQTRFRKPRSGRLLLACSGFHTWCSFCNSSGNNRQCQISFDTSHHAQEFVDHFRSFRVSAWSSPLRWSALCTVFLLLMSMAAECWGQAPQIQLHTSIRGPIRELSFSADNRVLVAIDGNAVTLWDVQRGLELTSIAGDPDQNIPKFISGHVGPSAHQLITRHYDDVVKLWDLDDTGNVKTFKGLTTLVEDFPVGLSADGRFAAFWHGKTGAVKLLELPRSDGLIDPSSFNVLADKDFVYNRAVAFSPVGNLLAIGYANGSIEIWDASNRQHRMLARTSHSGLVYSLAFNRDGTLLASLEMNAACFSPKTHALVRSCEPHGNIRIRDIATSATSVVTGVKGGLPSFAFTPDSSSIGVAFSSGVEIFRIGTVVRSEYKHDGTTTLAFAQSGGMLAIGDNLGRIELVPLGTEGTPSLLGTHQNTPVLAGAFLPNGRWMSVVRSGPMVDIVEIGGSKSRHPLGDLPGVNAYTDVRLYGATRVRLSNNGAVLAAGQGGSPFATWATSGAPRQCVTDTRQMRAEPFEISPVGNTLAIGTNEGHVLVWDVDSCKQASDTIIDHSSVDPNIFSHLGRGSPNLPEGGEIRFFELDRIESLAYSPEGSSFAIASGDNIVRVRRIADGRDTVTLRVPVPTVYTIDPAPGAIPLNYFRDLSGANEPVSNLDFGRNVPDRLLQLKQSSNGIRHLTFSPDGKSLATADLNGQVRIWDLGTGGMISTLGQIEASKRWYYKDEMMQTTVGSGSFTYSSDGSLGLSTINTVNDARLWNVKMGSELSVVACQPYGFDSLGFSPDGRFIASTGFGERTCIWDAKTGAHLATIVLFDQGAEWIVFTPDGLFDGSANACKEIGWRFSKQLFDVVPLEIFYKEFYYPGLLQDILSNRRPTPPHFLPNVDRRQPAIAIYLADRPTRSANSAINERYIRLRIVLTEAAEVVPGRGGGGVRDLRVFRNGSLVRLVRGDLLERQGNQVRVTVTVPIAAGTNRFTAYAFNANDVKSGDASLVVRGADSLKRQGVAYIVAIGINQYADPSLNLRFAAADAQDVAEELKANLTSQQIFSKVEVVRLLDEAATKENIIGALNRLRSDGRVVNPGSSSPLLEALRPAEPEDVVFVYFAGHGYARGNRFYLIPQDVGPAHHEDAAGVRSSNLDQIIARSITDLDLDRVYSSIDAGNLILIVDACNSGQVLESEERRRGPMNSKGIAQLAWEKGMYVLAAAQGYQAALEASKLGHGYLTYALIEEGLKFRLADNSPHDGQIDIREWFEFAVRRVPEMQAQAMTDARTGGRKLVFVDGEPLVANVREQSLQTPRAFYRTDIDHPFVISAGTKAGSDKE
jgi:WD40 repeat protein